MVDFNFIKEKFESPDPLELSFDFGSSSFNILAGNSNIITSIWADPATSRSQGKVYIASYGDGASFSVVDLNLKLLHDRYTKTIKGRSDEVLEQEDVKDVII